MLVAGAALVGVVVVVLAVWQTWRLPGSRAVSDIASVSSAVLATLATGYAAGRTHGRIRRCWQLLTVSSGLWACGQLSWTVHQLDGGRVAPNDWATAGLLLLSAVADLAGLLLLPTPRLGRNGLLRLGAGRAHGAGTALGGGRSGR